MNDPIDHWFPLQYLLKRSQKQKLGGKALVSQDCYEMAEMVSHFIHDLTKERMPDPDEVGNEGWKERIFGKPFDYNSKKTQKAILDHYLFHRPPLIALIYEGETEHEIIKKIFDALYIFDEKSGIIRCNARGADNIEKNFDGYFEMAKENEIKPFVIVDKDHESVITDHTRNGNIKDGMGVVWSNDFEYGWAPKLPIEKTLQQIFRMIPYTL